MHQRLGKDVPGICLAYAFRFKILPAPPCSNWVAAEQGFWIARVINDQRSTQHSGFHGAPIQTPVALSLGTRRAQVGPAMVMKRPRQCCRPVPPQPPPLGGSLFFGLFLLLVPLAFLGRGVDNELTPPSPASVAPQLLSAAASSVPGAPLPPPAGAAPAAAAKAAAVLEAPPPPPVAEEVAVVLEAPVVSAAAAAAAAGLPPPSPAGGGACAMMISLFTHPSDVLRGFAQTCCRPIWQGLHRASPTALLGEELLEVIIIARS
jgi:hypothetical protein